MATKKSSKKSAKATTTVVKTPSPGQIAGRVTWELTGHLKNAQLAYLRVGALLVRVKDEKLYAALQHPTIEDYASKRLALGRTSLYKYIGVYEWVGKYHAEWLQPKPKGFIPDLSDASSLIRIEQDLATATLTPTFRATLEALREKGLAGHLKQDEVERAYRAPRNPRINDSLKSFLASLRALRKRGAHMTHIPTEAISHIDFAIDVLTHAQVMAHVSLPTSRSRFLVRGAV
jgi:hypothetical protein